MEEHRGEEPPPYPQCDRRRIHRPEVDEALSAGPPAQALCPPDDQLEDEHADDRHEQYLGGGHAPDHDPPAGALTELATRLLDALGALVTDGGGDHTLGADRAVAPRAVTRVVAVGCR